MEKYKYNTIENYSRMDAEESFNILNEFEYFQLFFSDDIIYFYHIKQIII